MMKAARFIGPEKIEYSDVPKPQIEKDEVLIKVKAVGICGSDMELYYGEHNYIKKGLTKYPLIPGHEWSGQIEEVGSDVSDFKVGDRVTGDVSLGCGKCNMCKSGRFNLCPNRVVIGSYKNRDGAFAEYIKLPYKNVYKIPDNISYEEAAMVEPAATAAYGVIKGKVGYGDTVLVIGDGSIGQLSMQCAKIAGASKVFVVGSWDEKLEIAKSTGADAVMSYKKDDVLAKVDELTGGVGVDVVIESSGNIKTVNQSLHAMKPGGKVILLSLYTTPEFMAEINLIITKDAEVIGVLASPNTFKPTLDLMESGRINVRPLITQKFPLSKAQEAIDTIADRSICTIKPVLIP
ncbi:zinc-dependent alcohol dehydrogenase [Maledivibacter halophilus]|uniref:L-iditol 2-dehydrogenase n=1 Tax=Maledivibacter halophilus TaxID=36842 RepID=A0A1T5IAX4_9FIRM|nr:galactitol-1-phosphate 5-dehydrogenase [Maledivibacter halophilus]SKC36329.1 L-iditol 2-dehydrogenase [Maledivibacter halophilus]